jgi:hypothetical protein
MGCPIVATLALFLTPSKHNPVKPWTHSLLVIGTSPETLTLAFVFRKKWNRQNIDTIHVVSGKITQHIVTELPPNITNICLGCPFKGC